MAVGITFDKARAQHLVDCLNNGTAIEGIGSTEDMLALIGACRVVVAGRVASVHPGTRYRKLPPSRRRSSAPWCEKSLGIREPPQAQLRHRRAVADGT